MEIEIQVADELHSTVWATGDTKHQAALVLDHFTKKFELPFEWGEKANTGKEAIISMVAGAGPQELIRRQHTARPTDRFLYGSYNTLRALYRLIPYIQVRMLYTMQQRGIEQAVIWRSVNLNPCEHFFRQFEGYTVEYRESEPVYVIRGPK